MNFLIGFVVSLLFGLLAYCKKSVSVSGLFSGVVIGTLLYGFSGPQGFCLLAFFFIAASFFTRMGEARKKKMGLAQPNEGRRGSREALANCLPGLFFAFLIGRGEPLLYQVALVSSFAEALADTTSTELGQLCGGRCVTLPDLRPVPVGTRGAVSLEGTLFGILAALAMGTLGWILGFYPMAGVVWVGVAGTVGFVAESMIGRVVVNHEVRNFTGALLGGLAGILFLRIF